jgi:hypothetical protein
MAWNYRIIKNKNKLYDLHEVYYKGGPNACTLLPIALDNFESKKELIEALEMMLKDARAYRVLNYKIFEKPKSQGKQYIRETPIDYRTTYGIGPDGLYNTIHKKKCDLTLDIGWCNCKPKRSVKPNK